MTSLSAARAKDIDDKEHARSSASVKERSACENFCLLSFLLCVNARNSEAGIQALKSRRDQKGNFFERDENVQHHDMPAIGVHFGCASGRQRRHLADELTV